MSFQKEMTIDTYKELKALLGESGEFKLRLPEISVNTDRNDTDLLSAMASFVEKSKKIANILGVEIFDLKMKYDHESSDHETVVQYIELNPIICEGSYAYFKGDLCHILSEKHGVYEIVSLKTNEKHSVGFDFLRKTHWGEIFMVRDGLSFETIDAI